MSRNLFFSFLVSCVALVAANDWPIIGIFAQPTSSKEGDCGGDCTYIAASYVKQIESAGARVMPIDYYSTESEIETIFKSVNGVLFTGGGAAYPKSAQYMFDKIVAANDAGDFMPLWGTCMGFQWLLIAASRDQGILDPKNGQMDAYNYSIPLDFTPEASTSKLFGNAPKDIMDILAKQNVTMNNHHYGIWTDHFHQEKSLTSFYKSLSTNDDKKGSNFISTIEAIKYPIFGTQWHPEKNSFEWGKTNGIPNEAINHSPEAIAITQYTSNFFVQQARKNNHKFATPEAEAAALIDNYKVSQTTGSFMQQYFFHFKK